MTPETLKLRHRQQWEGLAARTRSPVYLVGSYLTDPETANDVDIVTVLGDFESPVWFDRLRAQIKLSRSLSEETGLPIDFKVQNGIQFGGASAEAKVKPFLLAEPGVSVVPEMDTPQERVQVAAIYVDTGVREGLPSSSYPETGFIFSGLRHDNCFTSLDAWADFLSKEEFERIDAIHPEQMHGKRQGFLTSHGRYVDRKEAMCIALRAGQVQEGETKQKSLGGDLWSEDLYK